MERIVLTFCLLLLLCSSFAQAIKDTIAIDVESLKTDCPGEKAALTKDYQNIDSTVIWMLQGECQSGYTTTAIDNINELVARFKGREFTKKYTEEKYIQDIYKAVHDKFLVSYTVNTPFYKIFENGTYNCVTASILFAAVFEKLNIDFDVKETPTHVYLVAKPKTLNITIETTTPTFGYLMHDDKFKSTYVNYLTQNKIISKEELLQSNTNELFNKYYYEDKSVSLKQLAAILYHNKAVAHLQKEDFKPALAELEKSYYLSPSARTQFLIEAALKEILSQNENSKKRDIDYIVKLAKINQSSENNGIIRDLYGDITLDLTEKYPDIERYKTESELLFASIKDSNLLKDLYYVYYMSMGSHSYYAGENTECMEYLGKAQVLFPENVKIKAFLTDVISKQLYEFEDMEDPQKLVDTLLQLFAKYPLLHKDKRFQQLITYSYAMQVEEGFETTDKTKMDAYLLEFDKNVQNNLYAEITDEVVAAIYTEAHKFFLRKNNYAMAKEYLKRGLKISPQNQVLKEKLELIKDSGH